MPRTEGGSERSVGAVRGGRSNVEIEPVNWEPLELHIGPRCAEFMWMYRENGLEYYKHIDTRQYLILDSSGACYRSQGSELVPVDLRDEFQRVTEAVDA
jgi:hypothetical protein